MKYILSITTIVLLTIGLKAQTAPDFGFDTWSKISISSVEDPNGWASLNALNAIGTGTALSVTKETTTNLFTGAASVGIKTVKVTGASIPNPYRPGKNFDTAGVLVVGTISASPVGLNYGYPMPAAFPRPSTLSFECKYNPMAGDSAFVLALLTKRNSITNKKDIIATGKYATGANTNSYSLNSLTMNYNPAFPNVMPDSEQIFISSSIYSHYGYKLGSVFYIDALAWSGYTSTNDIAGVKNNVSVFPNPANGQINFNSTVDVSLMELTDITGRLVGTYKMIDNKVTVQTSNFVPGMYLYNVWNDKKEIMNRGKFEVTK